MPIPMVLCRKEDLNELKRRFAQSIKKEKEQAHLSLLSGLEGHADGSKIFINKITTGEMANFIDNPFANAAAGGNIAPAEESMNATDEADLTRSRRGVVNNLEALMASAAVEEEGNMNQALQNVYTDMSDGSYQIPYFFLGDLIHVALLNIDQGDSFSATANGRPKKFNKTRLLLGPLELTDFDTPDLRYQVNLADVPISVNYFLEWFMNRIAAKQDVVWFIIDFIRDIVKNMLYNILDSDECFAGAIRQKANFQNIYLCGRGGNTVDKVQALIDSAADATLDKTI